jgi:hypothetical protein
MYFSHFGSVHVLSIYGSYSTVALACTTTQCHLFRCFHEIASTIFSSQYSSMMAYEVVLAFIQTYIYIYIYIHIYIVSRMFQCIYVLYVAMQSLFAQKHVIRLDLREGGYEIGRSRMKQSTIVSQVTTKTFA